MKKTPLAVMQNFGTLLQAPDLPDKSVWSTLKALQTAPAVWRI